MLERLVCKRVARCLSLNPSPIICRYSHSKRTHYDSLNLNRNCTNGEIRESFAKLSKQYHPDTCKVGSTAQNTKKFQEIMEAYKILNKKSSRDAYDAEISNKNYQDGYYGQSFRSGEYEMMRRYRAGEYHQYDPNRQHYYDPYWHMRGNNRGGQDFYGPYGPYTNKETYESWNNLNKFNRRRLTFLLAGFMMFNFIVFFLVYSASRHNRLIMKDFDQLSQYRYGAHGTHGLRYNGRNPNQQYSEPVEGPK